MTNTDATPLPAEPDATASPADATDDLGVGVHESGFGPLHVLAVLAVLATCWAARDLLVPIMLAMFLALIGNPLVRRLRKLWIPRWIGSLAVVFGGLAMAIFLASLLVGPAGDWVRQVPTELKQITPKLRLLTKQVDQANKAAESIAKAAGAAPASRVMSTTRRSSTPSRRSNMIVASRSRWRVAAARSPMMRPSVARTSSVTAPRYQWVHAP